MKYLSNPKGKKMIEDKRTVIIKKVELNVTETKQDIQLPSGSNILHIEGIYLYYVYNTSSDRLVNRRFIYMNLNEETKISAGTHEYVGLAWARCAPTCENDFTDFINFHVFEDIVVPILQINNCNTETK